MTAHCLNCGHPVKEKYCPQCGQATDVGRISWKSFSGELIHIVTHAEKSITGVTWQLLKNPGKVLDEYISGKHKKYQGPVGLYLVWVTAAIIAHRIVLAHSGFHPVYISGLTFSNPESIRAYQEYREWFYFLSFPLTAANFYLILGRPLYTYIESIVMTIYIFAVVYMFYTFCYLITGFVCAANIMDWRIGVVQMIISISYSLWVCYTLFRKKGIKFMWPRILLFLVINPIVLMKFLELLSNMWVRVEEYCLF